MGKRTILSEEQEQQIINDYQTISNIENTRCDRLSNNNNHKNIATPLNTNPKNNPVLIISSFYLTKNLQSLI